MGRPSGNGLSLRRPSSNAQLLWGCLRATGCHGAVTEQQAVTGLPSDNGAGGPGGTTSERRVMAARSGVTPHHRSRPRFSANPDDPDRPNHRCPTTNNTFINRTVTTCAALVTSHCSPTHQRMHRPHLPPRQTNINHPHYDQPPEHLPETVPQASTRPARRCSHS